MFMRKPKNHTLADNEQGFASIVIALVLIVVMGLLIVGFAQLARREQQSALDKQLATQAYYAAESGINSAAKDISTVDPASPTGDHYIYDDTPSGGATDASSTDCMTTTPRGSRAALPANALSAKQGVNAAGGGGVSFSCLLVDLTPSSLLFTNTQPGAGQYLAFSATSPLSSLTIEWGSDDFHKTFPTSGTYQPNKFPQQAAWAANNYPPVVQFSLTPTDPGGGQINRQALINNTFNVYLYPANDLGGFGGPTYLPGAPSNSTQVSYTSSQGQVVPGNCDLVRNSSYPCSVTIYNLNGTATNNYVLHYINYYDAADVYITGTTITGSAASFTGQAQVDVTGKAQNVLRRIQARLNADGTNGTITNDTLRPDDALQAQNICKRFQTRPANTDFRNLSNTADITPPTSDPCYLN
jgi:hypothetical protein